MSDSSLNRTPPGFQNIRAAAINDRHAVVAAGLERCPAADSLHLSEGGISAGLQAVTETTTGRL